MMFKDRGSIGLGHPFHDRSVDMKQADYSVIMHSPIGKLGIQTGEQYLHRIDFLAEQVRVKAPDNELAAEVVDQLTQYFENPMFTFAIACDMDGTSYQRRVWKRLKAISAGHYMTYTDVAKKLGSGARAVGGACRSNPIPIIVPCHRVVSKSSIGGYDGDWGAGKVNIKKWLLRHEGVI
jgi:methylated-DNA-[protein]-cysteine S-methyltransferase